MLRFEDKNPRFLAGGSYLDLAVVIMITVRVAITVVVNLGENRKVRRPRSTTIPQTI
jgi:hypothetical protein